MSVILLDPMVMLTLLFSDFGLLIMAGVNDGADRPRKIAKVRFKIK